jgi:H+-transporting ATPase
VQGATGAARAATIITGIVISRQRILNFITYRIAASLQLLLFFFSMLVFRPSKLVPDVLPSDWKDPMHAPPTTRCLCSCLCSSRCSTA